MDEYDVTVTETKPPTRVLNLSACYRVFFKSASLSVMPNVTNENEINSLGSEMS